MSPLRTRVALLVSATLVSTAAVTALAVSAPAVSGTDGGPIDAAVGGVGIRVGGALEDRGPLSRAELKAFDQKRVKNSYLTNSGTQSHNYTGPLLLDVLNGAAPAFSADKHDRFAITLLRISAALTSGPAGSQRAGASHGDH